jgi:hypothetical protein
VDGLEFLGYTKDDAIAPAIKVVCILILDMPDTPRQLRTQRTASWPRR